MVSVLRCLNKRVIENSVKIAESQVTPFLASVILKNATAQLGLSPSNWALEYYSMCIASVWLSQLLLLGRAAFC